MSLITYVTSIPVFFVLYASVLGDPRYVVGGGGADSVSLGAFSQLILIVANVGTAVVLFPILRRVNGILALGYVAARSGSSSRGSTPPERRLWAFATCTGSPS